MLSTDIHLDISNRIRSGVRPSVVWRNLIASSAEPDKMQFARDLAQSFPNQKRWLLLSSVFEWKDYKESDVWDHFFDFQLIQQLLEHGETLPWTLDECKQELENMKPSRDILIAAEKREADEAMTFEALKEKISGFPGEILCIQALWDGDSTGWFIRMIVAILNESTPVERFLVKVSMGGDIRLFNGQVPPWPEAVHAALVGTQLAEYFDAEFYFPSPDKTDDTCPTWLEKKLEI